MTTTEVTCGTCKGAGTVPAPEWMVQDYDRRAYDAGADWPEVMCRACEGVGTWPEREATR